ncbi:MAG TPA: alpha/beta hydrolase, partial [bacterium]|nr:alpha/beta hydrolase [bacterium]
AVLQPFRNAQGILQGYYHVPVSRPFLYLAPAGVAELQGFPLVLFQHGLKGRKEDVLDLAGPLTKAGFAVLATDLPWHGTQAKEDMRIEPEDDPETQSMKRGGWAMDFLALGAPLAARANLHQAAFNLHRLEQCVAAGAFSKGGLGLRMPSRERIQFVGTGTGAVAGVGYLAGNLPFPHDAEAPGKAMKALLNAPAGRIAYAIRDSPIFRPFLVAYFAQFEVSPASPFAHAFFQITQTVLDPVDPATLTTPVAPGLPSRLYGRILIQEATSTRTSPKGEPADGDLAFPNVHTRYLGNALGGRGVLDTKAALLTAPKFFQLGCGAARRIPVPFLHTFEGKSVVPKTASAGRPGAGTWPGEGYFQFDQAEVRHDSLLIPGPKGALNPMQEQMVHWLSNGTVMDPLPGG